MRGAMSATLGAFLVLSPSLRAQTEAPAEAGAPTREELQRGILVMEQQARLYEDNVRQITEQMLDLDQDVERRVERVVKRLTEIRDSKESRTRVANVKEDVLEGIGRNVQFYQRERARLMSELGQRYSQFNKEDLAKGISAFDAKVERRIEQALAISASFTPFVEQDRYDYYYDGYDGRTRQQTSPDYQQNRAESRVGEMSRKEVVQALKKDAAQREREIAAVEERARYASSGAQREALEKVAERSEKAVEKRAEQVDAVISGQPSSTQPVSGRMAHELDMGIRKEIEGIRRNHTELVRLYSERMNYSARFRHTQARLAVAREQLADWDGPPAAAGAPPAAVP